MYLISGFKNVGKDTLLKNINLKRANTLYKIYGRVKGSLRFKDMTRLSFGDPVKLAAINRAVDEDLLNLDKDNISDKALLALFDRFKNFPLNDGTIFREFADTVYASKHKEHWIELALDGIDQTEPYMATDWRHPEEYLAVARKIKSPVYTMRVHRNLCQEQNKYPTDESYYMDHDLKFFRDVDYLIVPSDTPDYHRDHLITEMDYKQFEYLTEEQTVTFETSQVDNSSTDDTDLLIMSIIQNSSDPMFTSYTPFTSSGYSSN